VGLARAQNPDDKIEKLKAVVRRLQAALAPSLFRNAPPDTIVIRELTAMLASDGVQNLLADAPDNPFAEVIRRARVVVEEDIPDCDKVNGLWQFMDDDDLNAELATDDENESPTKLVSLMLAGPYQLQPKAHH
jgi:hypothetical protein